MPNYNVMGMAKASTEAGVRYGWQPCPEGTRVNCISAGPIRTLAASGIASFRKMLAANEKQTPLRRNVTIEEVGNAGAFLCSDRPRASAARSFTSTAASTPPRWARWKTDPAPAYVSTEPRLLAGFVF